MYKIDRSLGGKGGGGSKNRILGRTPQLKIQSNQQNINGAKK